MLMTKKGILVVVIVIDLILSAWFVSTMQTGHNGRNTTEGILNDDNLPKTTHSVIRINGNTDFTQANGVISGDGTLSNPYIISGWYIDAKGKGAAIYIGNVTRNFTLENCYFYYASGGNGDVYYPNAGVALYNISSENVEIIENEMRYNDGDGIHISNVSSTSYISIGNWQHPEQENWIGNNLGAGINITGSKYGGITIRYNAIFGNTMGVHAYMNDANAGSIEINYNGFGFNTREAVKIEGTNSMDIFGNYFYKNDGSTDVYDPMHPQATQDGSSSIRWYLYDSNPDNCVGNFWYDWAENNNTNYNKYSNGHNYFIPWPYPILDTKNFSMARNYDHYSVKGFHHDAINISNLNGISNDVFNPSIGYVGLNNRGEVVITGLEINGTNASVPTGYGLLLNNMDNQYVRVRLDGMIIHNVTTLGTSMPWWKQGNGIAINNTIQDTIYISHMDIYNCHSNGIGIDYSFGNVTIDDTWIHDGASGATGLFVYRHDTKVTMFNSTIEHQGHWGVFIGGNDVSMGLFNNIISYNYMGINMPSELENNSLWVGYNSFFQNTNYAINLPNNKNSNMSIADNIFYKNHNTGDSFNPGYVQLYAAKYSNFSNYDVFSHQRGNYYHDWVNNNKSNDMNKDGIIDWGYKFDGDSIEDSTPRRWIDFMTVGEYYDGYHGVYKEKLSPGTMHLDQNNIGVITTRGTAYGLSGYNGHYYIVGWHNMANYTDRIGTKYGLYIRGNFTQYVNIYDVNISSSEEGLYAEYVATANIKWSTAYNNAKTGIAIDVVPDTYISYTRAFSNNYGINITGDLNLSGALAEVYENMIYENHKNGLSVSSYNGPNALYVYNNYIFGNGIGLYGEKLFYNSITSNGISDNANYGIMLKNSNGNNIYKNIFYYNNNTQASYAPENSQAYDNGNNYWNSTTNGNYWHDFSVNNISNDNNHDGIIDYKYSIAGGAVKDNYPLLFMHGNPIKIESVNDLNWAHGYIGGDGSANYPYLIVGWNIDGSSGDGLYLANISGSSYISIDHCLVNESSGNGFLIYQSKPKQIYLENIISMNNTHSGVRLEYSWNVTVLYSKTTHNYQSGINAYYSEYIAVYHSNMSENLYQGFNSYGTYNINLENNTMYKNSANGVNIEQTSITSADYGKIVDNTLRMNSQYGVKLVDSTGFIIYRNIFDRNNGASGNGTYDSNHIQAYDNSPQYSNLWNTTTEGNCWSDNSTSDPYHIDGGSSYDYHHGCAFVPEFGNFIFVALALLLGLVILRRRKYH